MQNQVFTAEEALTTERTVQRFVDAVRVDVWLLGELANMTGLAHKNISSYYLCF